MFDAKYENNFHQSYLSLTNDFLLLLRKKRIINIWIVFISIENFQLSCLWFALFFVFFSSKKPLRKIVWTMINLLQLIMKKREKNELCRSRQKPVEVVKNHMKQEIQKNSVFSSKETNAETFSNWHLMNGKFAEMSLEASARSDTRENIHTSKPSRY